MTTSVASPTPRPRNPAWATAGLLLPAYGWLLLAVFLPLSAMLLFSVFKTTPLGNRPIVLTADNYLAFVKRPYLVGVALDSLKLGLWTTGISAALGLPAALALARATRGRLRQTLFLLVILPFWTNGLVRVFSWTMVLRDGGILDQAMHVVLPSAPPLGLLYTVPAVVIGLVHAYLPYMILTCYLAVASIEDTVIDAARSLGARAPAVFFTIVLPLALPGLVSGAILIFVPVIGAFMEPRILGGRTGVTMGTVIEDQFTAAYNWPLGSALSFTMLAAVLVVFALSSGVLRKRLGAAAA